jgi:CRISPR-associated protein Cas1
MQYQKTLDAVFSFGIASDLIARKVAGQKALLKEALDRRPELRLPLFSSHETLGNVEGSLAAERDLDRLRGLEGGAAAAYFSAFTTLFPPSLNFTKRTKRPPLDPVNALLSLSYTMLHYELVRELQLIGLDPLLGFLHQFDYGRESLACDLVEPYRPGADRWVWELCRERTFSDRDFTAGEERPGCYLRKEARRRFYELYEAWAAEQRPRWTEEARALARRIGDGQDPVPEGMQRVEGEEGRPVALDT